MPRTLSYGGFKGTSQIYIDANIDANIRDFYPKLQILTPILTPIFTTWPKVANIDANIDANIHDMGPMSQILTTILTLILSECVGHQADGLLMRVMLGVHWASASWCQFASKIMWLARSGCCGAELMSARHVSLSGINWAPYMACAKCHLPCSKMLRQFAPVRGHWFQNSHCWRHSRQ